MSYEIPQSLQYKEKIIFGLNLEQLIYASIFGGLAFLIYARAPLILPVKITIMAVPAIFGLMFMFLDLRGKLSDLRAWHKFRYAELAHPKMKQFVGLHAVKKEGYYVIKEKKKEVRIAVLAVESLNFKIKPKDERDSIIYSFQKFLNALDFPIQFLMYTDDLHLEKYLTDLKKKTEKSENPVFSELFDGHKKYVEKLMSDKITLNRKFLIAVRENEMGLDAQLNIIKELLNSMKLKSRRLYGRQLIGILIKFFNNEKGRKELLKKEKNIYNITHPEKIENKTNYLKVNNFYNRIIAVYGYPRTVEEGFLDKIITSAGNFDLSVHIDPFPIENTLVMLNRQVQKQRADLYAAELKNSFSPSLDIQYKDTKSVLNSIQKGQEKLFNVSLYINVKARSLEELDVLTKTLQSKLNSILMIPKVAKFRQAQGLKSCMPFGKDELGIKRNITTYALSAFFPFTSPFLILEKGGVFLALNKNKLPIIKDFFNLSNPNGAILATSGGGKSYTAKLIVSRYLMNGTKVIVIDPQSEYTKLTEKYGGSVINISRTSETIINPLDLLGHNYAEKRLTLIDLFKIMFGDITEVQKAILDKALNKAYLKRGISEKQWDNEPPILGDVYEVLQSMSKNATVYERGTYTALLNRLGMYVEGVFSFLNKQTKIKVDNDFITFNIGNMPKQVKPVMMFLILDYVYSKMKVDRSRKLLVVDEAWSMLQNAGEEGYIFEVVKTCRKFNLGLLLITQDVADLLNSKAGRAVLANSSYTVLLRQKSAVINSVQEVFHLSHTEREHLLTANVGEGLLMMENDHQEIKIVSSSEEHKLITTKPEELLDIPTELPQEKKRLIIDLDLNKGFYKKSVLKPEEIDYLIKNNYVESRHVPLRSHTHSIFLVKKVGKHTPEHTFLLHAIYEELLEYTDKVKTDETSRQDTLNPDIVFTNEKGEEVALEIETGSNLRHHKAYLIKKVGSLNLKYGDNWHFVLSKNSFVQRYANAFNRWIYLRGSIPSFIKQHFPTGKRHRSTHPLPVQDNVSENGQIPSVFK